MRCEFASRLWQVPDGTWHFVTLPFDVTDEIDEMTAGTRRGFGSVRVEATVGGTTWRTSVFPDSKHRSFVLPVKRGVRDAERLAAGDVVSVRLLVIDD